MRPRPLVQYIFLHVALAFASSLCYFLLGTMADHRRKATWSMVTAWVGDRLGTQRAFGLRRDGDSLPAYRHLGQHF